MNMRGFWNTIANVAPVMAAVVVTTIAVAQWRDNHRQEARSTADGPVVPSDPIAVEGLPGFGSVGAEVALMVFSDFECPFCKTLSDTTIEQLRKTTVSEGQLRIIFRQWPLPIHRNAPAAARAAVCADRQGKFAEMHDELFRHQDDLGPSGLTVHAKTVGLDGAAFSACMLDERTLEQLAVDITAAKNMQLRSTPSMLLGTLGPKGAFVGKKWVIGVPEPGGLERELNALRRVDRP